MNEQLKKTPIVISAPSGGGKTTLNRRLVAEFPEIEISISHTTRKPRPGEIDGVHYHFVNEDQFRAKIENDDFIEFALVHGHLYGTSKKELQRILAAGKRPLLEIDVQGWLKSRREIPNAISVFILPPSLKVLWERLEKRRSDTIEQRMIRLHNAYHEIAIADHYQYFVVNDDLEIAYRKLKAIVVDGQPGDIDKKNGKLLCDKLKDEFHNAEWIQVVREKINS